MGYRSDVGIIIRAANVEAAKDLIACARLKGGRVFEAMKEYAVYKYDTDPLVDFFFSADDVKWYEGYDDVDGHEELFTLIDEHFRGSVGYRFARVGEEDTDIEHKSGGSSDLDPWDDLSIRRSISMNYSYSEGAGDKITQLDSLIGDIQ